jgi:hypothetical protein
MTGLRARGEASSPLAVRPAHRPAVYREPRGVPPLRPPCSRPCAPRPRRSGLCAPATPTVTAAARAISRGWARRPLAARWRPALRPRSARGQRVGPRRGSAARADTVSGRDQVSAPRPVACPSPACVQSARDPACPQENRDPSDLDPPCPQETVSPRDRLAACPANPRARAAGRQRVCRNHVLAEPADSVSARKHAGISGRRS